MRTNATLALVVPLLFLALPVFLVLGCGGQAAEDKGCPSGTYLAADSDTITGSADVSFTGQSSVGSLFSGGTVLFTPVTFQVSDSSGPKNNICLIAYTGDANAGPGPYWYTDATYSSYIVGVGPYNARTIVTDDTGVATLFWSTADLPAGNPRVVSGGTPTAPTYSAGKDQNGTSFIRIYSGSRGATFNVNWTVEGEPAQ